jgi:UDP-GlcNAc:undecaprenyl-phosphate/decaprenyl-phosphate GlcNAc-1-phosphate transferase
MNDSVLHAIVGFAAAAAATFAVLWLLQPVAKQFGLLDRPEGRKDHAAPTPSTGGLAMLLGIFLTFALLNQWTLESTCFIAAATLLVGIGILDDLHDLRWWVRVIAQCAAVSVMIYGGLRVERIGQIVGLPSTGLGEWSIPFTMFATVGVINAINMTDGVDGLAGGIVLAALCMLEAAAVHSGNAILANKLVVFAGAVFGFLLMNMRFPWQPRARVFMGNAGSALLGFTIAWASFSLTQDYGHPVSPVLPPWLVATPVIDCVSLIAHRLAHGQSPFRADREHMHHLMLDAGFTPTQVTIALIGTNLLLGLLAAIALLEKVPQPLLVLVYIGICVGYFWLTLRRERAVAAFAFVRRLLAGLNLKSDKTLGSQVTYEED